MSDQLSFLPKKRSFKYLDEKWTVELTGTRLEHYRFALEDAIELNKMQLKKCSETEKWILEGIIKKYEEEIKYLKKIVWGIENEDG